LKIGNSMLMLGNEFPPHCLSAKSRGGTSVSLYLYVENADASFDRAVKAGCTVKMPMTDQFWATAMARWKILRPSMVHRNAQTGPYGRPDCRERQGFLANMNKKSAPEMATA